MKILRDSRKERGATMLEMGLALTFILMPLMFGIIDFSRALYAYHFVAHAAREASRWAAVRGAACNSPMTFCQAMANGYVPEYVAGGLSGQPANGIEGEAAGLPFVYNSKGCSKKNAKESCFSIVPNWPGTNEAGANCTPTGSGANATGADSPGCLVQVTVTYDFGFLLPYLGSETNSFIGLSATSQTTISQ